MADELDKRLDEMEKSLGAMESLVRERTLKMQFGTRLTIAVWLVLIVALFVSHAIAWVRIRNELKPKVLADDIAFLVTDRIPAVKDALIEHAPDVVSNGLQMAVSDIPVAREWAEKQSLALVDAFGRKLEERANEMIGKMIEAHRAEIQPVIEAVANRGNPSRLEEIFRQGIESFFGQQMDEVLTKFDASMTGVEHRLDRYKLPDSQLNPDERLEKMALISVMSLVEQLIRERGSSATAPTPAATTP